MKGKGKKPGGDSESSPVDDKAPDEMEDVLEGATSDDPDFGGADSNSSDGAHLLLILLIFVLNVHCDTQTMPLLAMLRNLKMKAASTREKRKRTRAPDANRRL
jgi:hypothetical protein